MKKILGVILVLLAVAALWFLHHFNPKNPVPPSGSAAIPSPSIGQPGNSASSASQGLPASAVPAIDANPASEPAAASNLAARAGAVQPEAETVPPLDMPPEIVLQNVRRAITQYGATFGGNPVGTNPEITAALAGHNPKQINFISPEAGMHINNSGELVDTWGTPLFFHQLSGSDTEVRSAGPDRKMWTPDDLATR